MKLNLTVSEEFSKAVARFDRSQANWAAQRLIDDERLDELAEAARIASVGASCRLAGIRATDEEVGAFLQGKLEQLRQGAELKGYAAGLDQVLPGYETLLDSRTLRMLHARMLGSSEAEPSPWRGRVLYREGFDARGHATGHVFTTAPARLIEQTTEEVLTWLELELRGGENHPVLVIGTFLQGLLCISPFEKGNGRIVRLLTGLLLRRAGYDYVPYSSLEAQMEQRRELYHDAMAQAQKRIWTDEGDPTPWLRYYLQVLEAHREKIDATIALERPVDAYPPLQRRILETVREHGHVDAALLIRSTGANRNTLKDNLRRLVRGGVLEKTGERRGTRYRLSSGMRLGRPSGEALEH